MSESTARMTGTAGLAGWPVRFHVPAAHISSLWAEVAAVLLLAPMFLYAAWWNGFPFMFFDSGAYVLEGFAKVFMPERSPVYSLFLHYAHGRASLWNVAWVQSLLTAFVMVEFARAVWPRTSLWLVLRAAAALSVLTSIAWFAGSKRGTDGTEIDRSTALSLGWSDQNYG